MVQPVGNKNTSILFRVAQGDWPVATDKTKRPCSTNEAAGAGAALKGAQATKGSQAEVPEKKQKESKSYDDPSDDCRGLKIKRRVCWDDNY